MYKIKYESWKSDNGNIYSDYFVYVKTWYGWKHCTHLVGFMYPYSEHISFKTEKEAREFIKKMRERLPEKPIIII